MILIHLTLNYLSKDDGGRLPLFLEDEARASLTTNSNCDYCRRNLLASINPVLARFLGAHFLSHVTYFLLHPSWEMCCRQAVLDYGKFCEYFQ